MAPTGNSKEVDDLTQEQKVKVFWLQKHLYETGLEGIHFTGRMRNYLRDEGEEDIENDVEDDLSGRTF